MKDAAIMCPSYYCKPGAQLLGISQDDGTVAILPQPLQIDDAFIKKTAAAELSVQQRFRFTGKCIESGCAQWNGSGCGVVLNVLQYIDRIPRVDDELPTCGIRKQCRWYLQQNADACKICPYVLYQVTEADVLEMQQT